MNCKRSQNWTSLAMEINVKTSGTTLVLTKKDHKLSWKDWPPHFNLGFNNWRLWSQPSSKTIQWGILQSYSSIPGRECDEYTRTCKR
jgi:hypothetical protein